MFDNRYNIGSAFETRQRRAINSAARVPSSHGGSHWFESSIAHQQENLTLADPRERQVFLLMTLARLTDIF